MRRGMPSMLLVLAAGCWLPAGARADGGAIRLMQRAGDLQVSVFTVPTPLRVGQVDVSVFVQDVGTGSARNDLPVTVRANWSGNREKHVEGVATIEAASNKLFRAV